MMHKRTLQLKTIAIVVVLLLVLQAVLTSSSVLPVSTAAAGGESFQIFRGPSGPYEIVVGVLPHKPKVGVMHISVSVLEPGTDRPIEDVVIMIVAHDSEGEPVYQSPALQNPDDPKFYDANISFYTPGQWSLLVKVDSDAKGPGEAMVPMFISPTSLDPGIEGFFVLLIIVAAISGGVIYLWWSSRRKRAAALSR